jgi:SOS-response transcriptional repressor LexA
MTYKKMRRQVWLGPRNKVHTPIPGGKEKPAGKMIGVLRRV